jgi:acetate kinase
MPSSILVLNAGSSSLKFGLFEAAGDRIALTLKGMFEGLREDPHFTAKDASGNVLVERRLDFDGRDLERVSGALLEWIDDQDHSNALVAVGHRIVHGGSDFVSPAVLTDETIGQLDALTPLAPLHQPACLALARAFITLRPDLQNVGCFDTAFHSGLKPPVSRYAIPRHYEETGVRKFGFHGLSYEFIARRLKEMSPKLAASRTIAAHLGSGCSLCALRDGRSLDTTMGFTPLDGLVMSTRSGSVDPGLLLYLQQARGMSVKDIEQVLYHQSGLLGVSGVSSDVRELLASEDARAAEALDLFTLRIARETAALTATLEGLEVLVFSGGVGEHAWQIRERICARLSWLGVRLDSAANRVNVGRISSRESQVSVFVIPTNEELTVACHVNHLLTIE